jgi:hypothetical protein
MFGHGRWLRAMAALGVALLSLGIIFCAAEALQRLSPDSFSSQPLDSNHIYNLTNVWTIHLKFTPDQWDAMEPNGGRNADRGLPV